MSNAIRMLVEPIRSLGFASIGAVYMGIGTPIDHNARIIHIVNNTNKRLMFSFDGINDHFALPMNNFIQLDCDWNKTLSGHYAVSEGDRVYVKEINTPTSGSVYVTVFYGKDS